MILSSNLLSFGGATVISYMCRRIYDSSMKLASLAVELDGPGWAMDGLRN
jgi:hypothetical protein